MTPDKKLPDRPSPKRALNKKSVSFWIDEIVLEGWDKFCEEAGISRTQLIMGAVNDKLVGTINIRNLSSKIEKLAEIVSEINPDAESLVTESRGLNTRGRVLEQILVSKDAGLRREDVKGVSSYALQAAIESLENDGIIIGDQNGRYWIKEYFPE
ncbi:MAG TPA: hypothetical protein VKM55_24990 [Candidatus Lokiarchaeia archaeon]|nr:hypothetical protein [Candidatus Lokiarchaeia archaeon]